jgi:hypothetical protein
MAVSFAASGSALDHVRMLRAAAAARHGVNVPFAHGALANACELCPERV